MATPNATARHISEELKAAAREMLRRKRAQHSLHSYALSIDIPLSPHDAMDDLDEDLMGPARFYLPEHIALILDVLQRTVERPFGRCLIMAPPGSAKSSYTNVVLPSWLLGKHKKYRIIQTSYASDLAEKMSRRTQQVCRSPKWRALWDEPLEFTREAISEWALDNESELQANGILSGITGNRADGIIIDDPISGRQDADSPAVRKSTLEAYQNDVLTRVKPGAWIAMILTRWHENDLAGQILPEDYAGESGMILCRDGLYWEVLNLPAKCESIADPLGREIGEYLWPEWFPVKHWHMFENNQTREGQRTWSSLYQGRPSPQGSDTFDRAWFKWEDPRKWPPRQTMRCAIVSDWAVTESQAADFTEHFLWGVDTNGEVYLWETWSGQVAPDKSIRAFINMAKTNKCRVAYDEKGVIHNAVAPAINKAMKKAKVYVAINSIASTTDKVARVQSFQAIASTGIVHLPSCGKHQPAAATMVDQLIALPAGRFNDKADVAGLLGRVLDKIQNAPLPPKEREPGIKPFTEAWLTSGDTPPAVRRLR
jgi:predicted phage terminase large subunit-like protein